jgi:hypothetical protein
MRGAKRLKLPTITHIQGHQWAGVSRSWDISSPRFEACRFSAVLRGLAAGTVIAQLGSAAQVAA